MLNFYLQQNCQRCRCVKLNRNSDKRRVISIKQLTFQKYLMADPRLKQIRIKTGVVNRIAKEKQSYETETETEKNRLLKFKENGKF